MVQGWKLQNVAARGVVISLGYSPRIENHEVSCGMVENHDGLLTRIKIMKIRQIA